MAVTTLDNMLIMRRTDDTALYPLSAPTTAVGANSTTISGSISLPFTFTFDGVAYTSLAMSPRGFLRLAGTTTSSTSSTLFASSTNVMLAPWYTRLETATTGGYIKYETQGTAPKRRFVVEWFCNFFDGHDATNYLRGTFQCILFECSNKVEYRYGTLSTGGSPAANGSAAIGYKGVTSVVTSNYRDIAVDNLALGGSKTTSTTSLSAPTNWPSYTIVMQPNYPMDGRVRLLGPDKLSGLQERYSQPLQDLANNTNWHYCNHSPPLVNVAPDLHNALIVGGTQYVVVPVTPSGDGLSYTVSVGIYATALNTVTVSMDRDIQPDPQPQISGDWTLIQSSAQAVSSGYTWLNTWSAVIPATTEYLRFRVSATSGSAAALSILVTPALMTEPPSSATGIGWRRCGIGQIATQGGGQHPEFLNRMDRNVGLVMRDRKQMLWSATRQDYSGYYMTFSDMRLMSVGPCSLVGQRGATVKVVVYASDSGNSGTVILREHGGNQAKFTINANSGEYRRQTLALTLNSDNPLIEMSVRPSGTMKLGFAGLIWTPGD